MATMTVPTIEQSRTIPQRPRSDIGRRTQSGNLPEYLTPSGIEKPSSSTNKGKEKETGNPVADSSQQQRSITIKNPPPSTIKKPEQRITDNSTHQNIQDNPPPSNPSNGPPRPPNSPEPDGLPSPRRSPTPDGHKPPSRPPSPPGSDSDDEPEPNDKDP